MLGMLLVSALLLCCLHLPVSLTTLRQLQGMQHVIQLVFQKVMFNPDEKTLPYAYPHEEEDLPAKQACLTGQSCAYFISLHCTSNLHLQSCACTCPELPTLLACLH